ncbi:LPD1 domain-containing protein [Pseudomonas sp. PNPG3]|uniref:LPD1 domain-containing protein n=1 Tax=Pseudomonas sp. PNPG3 TaxID=2919497 RepID=UPI001FFC8304|nr:LPD1 domain-containing protein [Pseudomonas sp. PNPG3]MCK2122124.1 hypothetical protein [Pseudomonas sp. PNPG3]
MALNPIEKARLSARLLTLREQLQSGTLPNIQIVRVTAEALDIFQRLGGKLSAAQESPAAADPEQAAELEAQDGLSDDPNSVNYRYKDTGYISGSRKELAAAAIKSARDSGQMLRVTDIDFKAIEENPRQARELIKKSNLFGQVDWEGLQAGGMTPQAGYLVDRVYAAVAVMPSEDNPEARKAYALGIETLRTRLEQAKTVDDVTGTMKEIAGELLGTRLNAEESARYTELAAQGRDLSERRRTIESANTELQNAMYEAGTARSKAQHAYDNRIKRGWKIEPEHEKAVADATAAYEQANKAWGAELAATKDEISSLREQYNDVWQEQQAISDAAKARNLKSPEAQAWAALGERFVKATMYRKLRGGSDSFAGHVANAKAGQPPNWGWTVKEKAKPVKRASKKRITFTLKVVEQFERVGGRPVAVASTRDLERLCGFRAVQSGNWVLDDFVSAKWHVEQSAGAMMDMADVLGIDEEHLGFGGRLAMAFGARGTGGKGAARAHYEPVERVINMTKMNGGGSLGHEVFHAIDNILPSLLRGEEGAKDEWSTSNPDLMPAGAIRTALYDLQDALSTGAVRLTETIKISPNARASAKFNLDGRENLRGVALAIKQAGSVDRAVIAVDETFGEPKAKSIQKQKAQWRALAAAYYAPDDATEVTAATGIAVSDFYREAMNLDDGVADKYWSQPFEMAARAFQAYLEDRLAEQGRKNDYLSCLADNKHHYFPELDMPFKPYPEGEERVRINAAFDQLFKALRDEKAFEKAMSQTALLDAIFGVTND